MQVPGIEAYSIHHLPSGNFRVVAAKADDTGFGWSAHVCDFNAEPNAADVATVPEVGTQITSDEAFIAFSHQDGLWEMLNDHLGQYLEPTKN
jgi:hypothetical protein